MVPVQANHDETEASLALSNNRVPAMPSSYMEGLQRQAQHPLASSPEYLRALAGCTSPRKRRTNRGKATLSSGGWNPRLIAVIILLLIALSVIIWVGFRGAYALSAVVNRYNAVISHELAH